jgi:hypothetical protein
VLCILFLISSFYDVKGRWLWLAPTYPKSIICHGLCGEDKAYGAFSKCLFLFTLFIPLLSGCLLSHSFSSAVESSLFPALPLACPLGREDRLPPCTMESAMDVVGAVHEPDILGMIAHLYFLHHYFLSCFSLPFRMHPLDPLRRRNDVDWKVGGIPGNERP